MDYKKKYNEAQKWIESIYSELSHEQQMEAEAFFPELKESEDEKMMHQLHSWMKEFGGAEEYTEKIYTWLKSLLEKQGEKRKVTHEEICKSYGISDIGEFSDGYHTFNELYYYRMLYNAAFFNMLPKEWVHKSKKHHDGEECFGGGWFIVMANLPTGQVSNHYELKDWDLFQIPEKETADEWDGHTPQEAADRLHKYLLEKQGEQETTDKVEPKFQNGQWIVWQNKCYKVNYNGCGYELIDQNGLSTSLEYGTVDKSASAFTIQDAKDGDVLCTYECDEPKIVFILKGTPKKHYALSYHCYYNIMYPHFASDSEKGCLAPNDEDVKPATKEQRDALFAKMKKAGYTWNADKKQLKKIEQKPWSEEDKNFMYDTLSNLTELKDRYGEGYGNVGGCIDWLKSIKQRIGG